MLGLELERRKNAVLIRPCQFVPPLYTHHVFFLIYTFSPPFPIHLVWLLPNLHLFPSFSYSSCLASSFSLSSSVHLLFLKNCFSSYVSHYFFSFLNLFCFLSVFFSFLIIIVPFFVFSFFI